MKGQFGIDFYVALILFVVFVTYLFFQLLQSFPAYTSAVNLQILKSEAFQISEILANDPGQPLNWDEIAENSIERVGLSDHTVNKTNLLSVNKITNFQTKCVSDYEDIRRWLATDYQLSILLINIEDGTTLVNCFPPQTITRGERVEMTRIVGLDSGSYGNLTVGLQ